NDPFTIFYPKKTKLFEFDDLKNDVHRDIIKQLCQLPIKISTPSNLLCRNNNDYSINPSSNTELSTMYIVLKTTDNLREIVGRDHSNHDLINDILLYIFYMKKPYVSGSDAIVWCNTNILVSLDHFGFVFDHQFANQFI